MILDTKICINDNIVFKKFSSNYFVMVENGYEINPLIKYVLPKLADIGLAYCLEIKTNALVEAINQLTRIALEASNKWGYEMIPKVEEKISSPLESLLQIIEQNDCKILLDKSKARSDTARWDVYTYETLDCAKASCFSASLVKALAERLEEIKPTKLDKQAFENEIYELHKVLKLLTQSPDAIGDFYNIFMSKVKEVSTSKEKKNIVLYWVYKTKKGINSEELLSLIRNQPTEILDIYKKSCEEFKEIVKYLLFSKNS